MQQRGLGLEQTGHRQALLMHTLYKVLQRRTRMHAVRAQKRKLERLLGKTLTMRPRGEVAGRTLCDIARFHGVRRGAQIQLLSRRLNLIWRVRRRPPLRWRRKGARSHQAQRAEFKRRNRYCLCF